MSKIPPPTAEDLSRDLAQQYGWLDNCEYHSPSWAGNCARAAIRRALAAEAERDRLRRLLRPLACLWDRHGEDLPKEIREECRQAKQMLGGEP